MNRHLERQKLLNRLALAENEEHRNKPFAQSAYNRQIKWREEIAKLNALLAADEEKE